MRRVGGEVDRAWGARKKEAPKSRIERLGEVREIKKLGEKGGLREREVFILKKWELDGLFKPFQ